MSLSKLFASLSLRLQATAIFLSFVGIVFGIKSYLHVKHEFGANAAEIFYGDLILQIGVSIVLNILVAVVLYQITTKPIKNISEAMRAHNAIITGPHTHNFASIIEQFEANAAIRVVADKDALAAHTMALLKDDAARETLAVNAQKTVEQFRGASTIILQHVGELIARGSA